MARWADRWVAAASVALAVLQVAVHSTPAALSVRCAIARSRLVAARMKRLLRRRAMPAREWIQPAVLRMQRCRAHIRPAWQRAIAPPTLPPRPVELRRALRRRPRRRRLSLRADCC